MSRLAQWIARRLWWFALWLMRRPKMKVLQKAAIGILPERSRQKAMRDIYSQNRFARRYGEKILEWVVLFVLASLSLSFTLWIALWLNDQGFLTLSDEFRQKVESKGSY